MPSDIGRAEVCLGRMLRDIEARRKGKERK